MMKKIIGLTIAALLIIGTVAFGTAAYFSDTESSTNNTLSAGTLDLKVATSAGAYGDVAVTTFAVSNIKPGDTGNGITRLKNNGSLAGVLGIATSTVSNNASAGGTEFEGGSGELGAAAEMAVYVDVNQNDAFNDGVDFGLNPTGPEVYTAGPLVYATINTYASKTWSAIETMAAASEDNLRVEWRLPNSGDQNTLQGDSVSIDFTFSYSQ